MSKLIPYDLRRKLDPTVPRGSVRLAFIRQYEIAYGDTVKIPAAFYPPFLEYKGPLPTPRVDLWRAVNLAWFTMGEKCDELFGRIVR